MRNLIPTQIHSRGQYRKEYRELQFELATKGDSNELHQRISKLNRFYAKKYSINEIAEIQMELYAKDFDKI